MNNEEFDMKKYDMNDHPDPDPFFLHNALRKVLHTVYQRRGQMSFTLLGDSWVDFREACIALEWFLIGAGRRAHYETTLKVMQKWINDGTVEVNRSIAGEVISIKLSPEPDKLEPAPEEDI